MKKLLILSLLFSTAMTMSAAKVKTVIDRIEPTDWFVGLKNPQVQLMVYGKGINNTETVSTDYPGVVVDSLVHLDSPNYLLVYMNVKNARPGTMTLNFEVKGQGSKVKGQGSKVKGQRLSVQYQLKQREMRGPTTRLSCPVCVPTRKTATNRRCATAATSKVCVSTSTISTNWASRPCGLRLSSRTTRPTWTAGRPTTAMPAPTTTV